MRKLLGVLLAFLTLSAANAQIVGTIPYTFTNGTVIDANQVNSNFGFVASQTNTNGVAKGSNSSITALLGLTTPLSAGQGGSSVYTAGTSTGSANAQIVATPSPSGFVLVGHPTIIFTAGFTNTGPTQFNVNATGLTNVYEYSSSGPTPLTGGEIVAGSLVVATFDGAQYQLINFTNPLQGGFGGLTNIASAATTDLGTVGSHFANVTGTTTITSFGSSASIASPIYLVRFDNALTLTYDATALVLPGSANITTALGDFALAWYRGAGDWTIKIYIPASGQPVVPIAGSSMVTGKIFVTGGSLPAAGSVDLPVPSDAQELEIELEAMNTSSTGAYYLQYKVGGSVISSNYVHSGVQNSGSTVIGASSTSDAIIPLQVGSTSESGVFATVKVQGVQNGIGKGFSIQSSYYLSSNMTNAVIGGNNVSSTGLISDILITSAGGNWAGGTYRMYKIK